MQLPVTNRAGEPIPDSVFHLLVFTIAGQRYALHLPVVERVLRMVEVSPLPKAPVIVLGVINFHGRIIPAIDVQRRFGLPSSHYGHSSCLVVARTKRRALALPVDETLGVQEVPSANIATPDSVFPGTGLVAGIAALSDGVLFIHDLETFLSLDEEQQLTEAIKGQSE